MIASFVSIMYNIQIFKLRFIDYDKEDVGITPIKKS